MRSRVTVDGVEWALISKGRGSEVAMENRAQEDREFFQAPSVDGRVRRITVFDVEVVTDELLAQKIREAIDR